jgi:hypothetical protein
MIETAWRPFEPSREAVERAKGEVAERTGRVRAADGDCQREDCVGFCYWCRPPSGRWA